MEGIDGGLVGVEVVGYLGGIVPERGGKGCEEEAEEKVGRYGHGAVVDCRVDQAKCFQSDGVPKHAEHYDQEKLLQAWRRSQSSSS